jgi:hypothetical protein
MVGAERAIEVQIWNQGKQNDHACPVRPAEPRSRPKVEVRPFETALCATSGQALEGMGYGFLSFTTSGGDRDHQVMLALSCDQVAACGLCFPASAASA